MRRTRNDRSPDERGQGTIEILATIPFALLITGAIIQLFFIGFAAVSAEGTSRQAARDASKGVDHTLAAADAKSGIPGFFESTVEVSSGDISDGGDEPSVTGTGSGDVVSARTEIRVPVFGLGFGIDDLDIKVTRYAVMPVTDDDGGFP